MAAFVIAAMLLGACSGSTGSRGPSPIGASPGHIDINNQLLSVTCASTSHCIAVGSSGDLSSDLGTRTLIEEDSGGGWTIVPSPTPPTSSGIGSLLGSVTCANTTHCIAVGSSSDRTSIDTTLIEENTGSGWTIVPSPNPTAFGRGLGSLAGVTCASATDCIAVGSYEADNGHFQTLIEENTGSGWTIVPSPNISSGADNSLSKVACAKVGRCIAVGSHSNYRTLIEENTGSGWSIVPSPNNSDGYDTALSSVACTSAGRCVAVGFASPAYYAALPFTVENAGNGWSTIEAPKFDGSLSDITCADSTSCIAVGNLFAGAAVIEQEAGSAWTLLPQLTLSSSEINGPTLNSVACAKADRCFIVGAQFLGYGSRQKTLIVENTGSGWALVSSPNVTG